MYLHLFFLLGRRYLTGIQHHLLMVLIISKPILVSCNSKQKQSPLASICIPPALSVRQNNGRKWELGISQFIPPSYLHHLSSFDDCVQISELKVKGLHWKKFYNNATPPKKNAFVKDNSYITA